MAHFDATHSTATHDATLGGGLIRLLTAPVRGLWNFLIGIAESNAAMRRVERLSAMSDEALARRGLKREDIVREVFFGSTYF